MLHFTCLAFLLGVNVLLCVSLDTNTTNNNNSSTIQGNVTAPAKETHALLHDPSTTEETLSRRRILKPAFDDTAKSPNTTLETNKNVKVNASAAAEVAKAERGRMVAENVFAVADSHDEPKTPPKTTTNQTATSETSATKEHKPLEANVTTKIGGNVADSVTQRNTTAAPTPSSTTAKATPANSTAAPIVTPASSTAAPIATPTNSSTATTLYV